MGNCGIYVNQVGYFPKGEKLAIVTRPGRYRVMRVSDKVCVYETEAAEEKRDAASGDVTWRVDFSAVEAPGKYFVEDETGEKSDSFELSDSVYRQLQRALAKALYYQRCGCALEKKYAGIYTHAVCHSAPSVFLEDYVNKTENPRTFDMTGGWHDAGDYGRYSTAGAVAVAHLLYAYELFPESFQETLNIPESGNGMPDVLNECLYELKWLLKMQAQDGGVYHKLTAFQHAPFIMPQEDKDRFLIYPKSSMAAGDFAAVMALASRVYRAFLPEFANTALLAARKAFSWLEKNPYVGFHNPEGSNTGEYDDEHDEDERMWAAAEMLRSDFEEQAGYRSMLEKYVNSDINKTDFGWTDVSGFTLLAVLTDEEHRAGDKTEQALREALFAEADRLTAVMQKSGYPLAMEPEDYVWGSNMVVCNRGMLLILAALLSQGEKAAGYRRAVENQLHYLLGRNALNRSYVTGFGEHAFKNPHNRPTFADGIDLPMPGWVSGGPFKTPCDPDAVAEIPAGTPPMKCHADVVGSYSTNEITIYWNSPAVFMTAYLNAIV